MIVFRIWGIGSVLTYGILLSLKGEDHSRFGPFSCRRLLVVCLAVWPVLLGLEVWGMLSCALPSITGRMRHIKPGLQDDNASGRGSTP